MPRASEIGPATGLPSHGPGTLTRNRVVPAAGSYRPGTPTPAETIPGHAAMTSAPIAARRPTTASGPSCAGVGPCPVASARQSSPSCSTTAHLVFVPPRSRPRWRLRPAMRERPPVWDGWASGVRPAPGWRRVPDRSRTSTSIDGSTPASTPSGASLVRRWQRPTFRRSVSPTSSRSGPRAISTASGRRSTGCSKRRPDGRRRPLDRPAGNGTRDHRGRRGSGPGLGRPRAQAGVAARPGGRGQEGSSRSSRATTRRRSWAGSTAIPSCSGR